MLPALFLFLSLMTSQVFGPHHLPKAGGGTDPNGLGATATPILLDTGGGVDPNGAAMTHGDTGGGVDPDGAQ
jgi:hypothetical protein